MYQNSFNFRLFVYLQILLIGLTNQAHFYALKRKNSTIRIFYIFSW